MKKKWTLNDNFNADLLLQLRQELNISEPIAKLLLLRGIDSFEKAKNFFRPSIDQLYDPFLMKDMNLAVDRLTTAIHKGEKIMIYGDYDVDGTTSVALLSGFLSEIDVETVQYIPNRYSEGYGISVQGIQKAKELDCNLIIALDCGIRAVEQIQMANELGIDFIICDHHLSHGKIPDAIAVLDPNRSDCTYPFKGLSGCGVGFKLCQAFCIQNDIDQALLYKYIDLLVVSIGADIVPIVDENRILAHFGLIKINEDPLPGFQALMDSAEYKKSNMNIMDVVFTLAPRINAAGRIESGVKAVKLMLSKTIEEAQEFAESIELNNSHRRELDKSITENALSLVSSDPNVKDSYTTVVHSEEWHKGVIGIVASRLIESYFKPTIVLTESENVLTGSARSIPNLDIHEALTECEDLLIKYGGHAMAAGLSIEKSNLEKFKIRFEEIVRSKLTAEQLIPEIKLDLELDLKEIRPKFYKILKQFAPFGPSNLNPVFRAKGIVDANGTKTIGADHSHLKLWVKQLDPVSIPMGGIGFGLGNFYSSLTSGEKHSMVFSIEENEWREKVSLQLSVKDLRVEE